MSRHVVSGLIVSSVAALLISACGSGSSSPVASSTPPATLPTPTPVVTPTPSPTPPSPTPAPVPSPGTLTIDILGINGGMSFSPSSASLQVGQQVRWHNADSITHTATQNGGGFDTGAIAPGGTSAPMTASAPGALNYHCSIHPSMVGTLNVTP